MGKGLWLCGWTFRNSWIRGWQLRALGEAAHNPGSWCPMTMPMSKSRLAMAVALVIASVAIPVVLWRSTRFRLQEAKELSAKGAEEVAQLTEDNQSLSNLVGQAKQSLSTEEAQELLRLRSEIGRLRGEMRDADKLRQENQLLKTPSPAMAALQAPRSAAELETELSMQTIDAMKDLCRELPAAL